MSTGFDQVSTDNLAHGLYDIPITDCFQTQHPPTVREYSTQKRE